MAIPTLLERCTINFDECLLTNINLAIDPYDMEILDLVRLPNPKIINPKLTVAFTFSSVLHVF